MILEKSNAYNIAEYTLGVKRVAYQLFALRQLSKEVN